MPATLAPLRVALSTIGVFHTFDLARQLEAAGVLDRVLTGYPQFKLRRQGVPAARIHSFPWLQGPNMAGWVPSRLRRNWEFWNNRVFGRYVAATLPECDIYCGLSGSSLSAGRVAHARGARYVCDRVSAHIRTQDAILRAEHQRWSIPFAGIDPRIIDVEEQEYAQADAILVPSTLAYRSFVAQGIPAEKLHLAPYGVDMNRFSPRGIAQPGGFDCLFVGGLSVQKGAGYLFAAYERLRHPRKRLTIVGVVDPKISPLLQPFLAAHPEVRLLGHVPQDQLREVMSAAHVLILPRVQDGLGLVQAQAMACTCPVIATFSTGAHDLYTDSIEGYIVEPSSTDALVQAMQRLADEPHTRDRFSAAALERVRDIGGWDRYGRVVLNIFRTLHGFKSASPAQLAVTA
jgi:glycosyltransferase involved in cell wall biosynthesis